MRLFVGVELSGPALDYVLAVRETLVREISRQGVRFVRPEKLHLTAAFLGEVDEPQIEALSEALGAIREPVGFELEIGGLGGFPDLQRPKVLWIGVRDPSGCFAELPVRVADSAKPFARDLDDKPIIPHLTLARISPGSKEVGRIAQRLGIENPEVCVRVESFSLIWSKPDGSYEVLKRFQ